MDSCNFHIRALRNVCGRINRSRLIFNTANVITYSYNLLRVLLMKRLSDSIIPHIIVHIDYIIAVITFNIQSNGK